jgi:hypothetical protein
MFLMLTGCASTQPAIKASPARSFTSVVVAADVLHGFSFLYQYVNETEFVLCLEGTQDARRLYVTGFRLAVVTKTTINTVSYEPCTSRNYLGTAHNHPPEPGGAQCAQSASDQNSFYNDQKAVVDIILCGNTRYLWVLKDGRSSVDDGMSRVRQLLAKSLR